MRNSLPYFGPRERLDELTTRKVMKLQDHLIKERKYAASTINYLNSLLVGYQNLHVSVVE